MRLQFTKMQGLGNDFVVIDAVSQSVRLTARQVRVLGDRKFGVGCDQVLLAEHPTRTDADFFYRIYNADGSEVEQCGNGARCLARFVRDRGLSQRASLVLETVGGLIGTELQGDDQVAVDMGVPRLEPAEIPLLAPQRLPSYRLTFEGRELEFAAVSMGNPHAVLAVPDVDSAPVDAVGQFLQAQTLFPRSVNVGFLEIVARDAARLRVYERGAGETLACGTGACAAMVAGRLWGRLDARVRMGLRGGELVVQWPGEGAAVIMTGPAVSVYEGAIQL